MERILDTLDHPIMFVFFMTLAVFGTAAVATWGFKRLGWTGPAAFFQHP